MAQENIDFGAYPNDPDADAIRVAFQKVQNNFSEIYSTALTTGVDQVIAGTGILVDQNIGNVTVTARIPQITIQTGDSLKIGVSAATTNTATITSGSTPFVITLANTINTINIVATGNLVGTLAANASSQPNITSVGTLANLSVSGNINAQNLIGNVVATNLSATNIGIAGANTQLLYNYQGNIRSASGLTFDNANLTVANRVQAGNLSVTGNSNVNIVRANYLYGDGSNLTNVNIATAGTLSVPNLIASGNLVGTLAANASSQPNITTVGVLSSLSVTGTSNLANVNAGNISATGNANVGILRATYLYGDGSNLTNLSTPTSFSAGNVSVSGNITGRLSAASALQPNITTVGTLSNLSVAGTVVVPNVSATYISASGNISAPGTNTQVVFNNQGNLAGSTNLVFTGSNLNVAANLNATGNISGNNATLAGRLNATGNISAAGNISTASNLNVSGNAAITGTATISGNAVVTGKVTAGTISSIGNIDSGGNLNANSVTLSGEANANIVRAVYLYGDGSNISNVGTVVPRNEITRGAGYVSLDINGYIHGGDSVNGDQFIVKAGNGLQALNKFSITDGTANYFSSNTTDASFDLGQNFEGSTFTVECQDNVGAQLQISAPAGGVGNSQAWLGANTVIIAGTGTANAKLSSINLTGSTISVVGNLVMNSSPASSTNNTQVATTAFVQTLVGTKANLASPIFSGTPTAPTAANGTNNTQIATTQFVANAIAAGAGAGGGTFIANGNSNVSTSSNGNIKISLGDGNNSNSTFAISLNDGTGVNQIRINSGNGNAGNMNSNITTIATNYSMQIVGGGYANGSSLLMRPDQFTVTHLQQIRMSAPTTNMFSPLTYISGNLVITSGSPGITLQADAAVANLTGANSKIFLSGAIPANASNTMVPTTAWVTGYTQTAIAGAISNAVTSNNFVLTKIGPASGTNTGSIVNNDTLATTLNYANMYFPVVLGTQDFTFEGWFKYTSIGATNGTLFGLGGGAGEIIVKIVGTTLNLVIFSATASLGTAPATNTWFHVAVSKNAGTIRVFANGIAVYTSASYSATSLGSDMVLGQQLYTAGTYFNGLITNVRFVAGTGVYSSNFTPPTSALTAISGTTLLLLTQNLATVNFDNSGNYRFNNMFQSNFGYNTDSPITTQTNTLTVTSPITLPASYTMRLPGNLGSNGQVLSTDGTGNLNWITASGGSGGTGNLITSGGIATVATSSVSGVGFVKTTISNADIITTTAVSTVFNNGNVGIGVPGNPTARLDIAGIQGSLTEARIRSLDDRMARVSLVNTVRNWSISNYGNQFAPNGQFAIADETQGAVRFAIDVLGNVTVTSNLIVSGITSLGANSNVKITGGTTGQVLSTDGTGNLSWITATGGGGATTTISNANSIVSTFAYGQVSVSTGALQTIFSNAGVGIGTNSPTSVTGATSVTINGGANGGRVDLLKSGTQFGAIYSAAANLLDIEAIGTNTAIRLNTNGAERMRIDPNGNVGIGTTTPSYKLDITAGTLGTTAGSTVSYQRLVSFDTNADYLEITNTRQTAGSSWVGAGSRLQQKVDATWMAYIQFNGGAGTTNDGGISFGTGTTTVNSTSILERMRIDASGNVGIGTTTPAAKLDVNGTVNISGNTAIAGNATITGNTTITGNVTHSSISKLGPVGNVQITGGSSGQVLSTDGTGNLSWVAQSGGGGGSSSYNGFKNRLINGAFNVWQRGTSFNISTNGGYTADRWFLFNPIPMTFSQSTDVPQGFVYSAKAGRAAGQASGNYLYIGQNIEYASFSDLVGQPITVSFWAKKGANFSGTSLNSEIYTGTSLDQGGNAGIQGLWVGSVSNSVNIAITNTWAKYSYTYTLPANAKSLVLDFGYTCSGTAGADDNFYITGIQFEAGSTATSYDAISPSEALSRCQRFYCKNSNTDVVATHGSPYTTTGMFSSGTIGAYGANAGYIQWIPFPVSMFRAPNFGGDIKFINPGSLTSGAITVGQWMVYNAGTWASSTTLAVQSVTTNGMGLNIGGTFPAGTSLWYGAWTVSADL